MARFFSTRPNQEFATETPAEYCERTESNCSCDQRGRNVSCERCRPAANEPDIVVNGVRLTSAQAMAVRVAVTSYREFDAKDPELGDIGPLYHARLSEVLDLVFTRRPTS